VGSELCIIARSSTQVTYDPDPNYNGSDGFNFKANDGHLDSDAAHVSITVTPVNDKPTVATDSAQVTVNEGQTASNTGTYGDVDGDTVTFTASVGTVTKPAAGTWAWSFLTADGPSQSQTVTITANDGNGGTETTTFPLTVNNVAPSITSLAATNSLSGPLVFGTPTTFSGSFDDPGLKDYAWMLEWAWDGVADPAATQSMTTNPTYALSHPFSQSHKYTTPGCSHSATVKVTDKDTGSDTRSATVQVGTGEFLPPMTNQPVTDKLKNGQVLPVKVRIADCNGTLITGLSPKIEVRTGDQTDGVNDDATAVIPSESVSAADTNGFMRQADGFYVYNLRISVPSNQLNSYFTVVITPGVTGFAGQTIRHKIMPTK
jgi:hypothetical protein